jgi:hypothetical protein
MTLKSGLSPERERLYRFMRLVGFACVPFACGVGVVFGIAFGLVPGLVVGLLAISVAVYPIFGFPRVNEALHRRSARRSPPG